MGNGPLVAAIAKIQHAAQLIWDPNSQTEEDSDKKEEEGWKTQYVTLSSRPQQKQHMTKG